MSDAIRRYRASNPLPSAKRPLQRNDLDVSPLETGDIADRNNYNGWLSPDGQFYPCTAWEHEHFAWRLAERHGYSDFYSGSKALEEHEWLKLKSGDWIIVLVQECTQRQIDALFDWCQSRGRTLESLELL